MLHVLMMMNVIMLMEARQVAVIMVLLEVLVQVVVFVVKAFVVEVQEVFLFSLSSTTPTRTTPSTRPAGRVWAFGAKGLGFQFAAPAPGRRCSGPFS
jgi:hypothetical protein